jgi:hypothetical protein
MKDGPRCGRPKACSWISCRAVAAAIPFSTKNTIDAVPTTALAVASGGANSWPTSLAAWPFRPVYRVSVSAADQRPSALTTMRNGMKHNSSVAAKRMPLLMNSIASSRCHSSSCAPGLPYCVNRRP